MEKAIHRWWLNDSLPWWGKSNCSKTKREANGASKKDHSSIYASPWRSFSKYSFELISGVQIRDWIREWNLSKWIPNHIVCNSERLARNGDELQETPLQSEQPRWFGKKYYAWVNFFQIFKVPCSFEYRNSIWTSHEALLWRLPCWAWDTIAIICQNQAEQFIHCRLENKPSQGTEFIHFLTGGEERDCN